MTTKIAARILAVALVLANCLAVTTPASAQPQPGWRRVNFSDGSGGIDVAPGWRIGSVVNAGPELGGPSGEFALIGFSLPIAPQPIRFIGGPYLAPREAFAMVASGLGRREGFVSQVTRVVEYAPTAPLTQGGQAAYMLVDMNYRGQPYRSFVLVNTAPLSGGYWQFYQTWLAAPAAQFPQALPTMMKMWQSWSISQGEMNRRTQQAIATMKEVNAIMRGTSATITRDNPKQREVTRDNLGGEWVVLDTLTGIRIKATWGEINAMMEREPGRYRVLSTAERTR